MNVDLYESTGDYMIVDLDTGNYAFEDLRATQAESNARYNIDRNKGERLVLRKVPKTSASAYPDGYPTGNSTAYPTANTETNWTTTVDYFIGIFELTSAQYDRLMSGTASESYKPKGSVKWQTLRGVGASASSTSEVTANATGGGVFQRLSAKTGLYFDMPTELMWEIACRAGEKKAYPWGADDTTDLGTYAWYSGNSGNSTQPVGGKAANNWGLFDMLGNVMEMCRDGKSQANLAESSSVFTPAANPSSNYERRIRGGSYRSAESNVNPSSRGTVNHQPSSFSATAEQGCRAALYIK
jgi:formylglycine-generating enzyme required for sulfatase activity